MKQKIQTHSKGRAGPGILDAQGEFKKNRVIHTFYKKNDKKV